jgi:hypothetical protein
MLFELVADLSGSRLFDFVFFELFELFLLGCHQRLAAHAHLEIERDPCRGMVACVFLSTHPSINTAGNETVREIW